MIQSTLSIFRIFLNLSCKAGAGESDDEMFVSGLGLLVQIAVAQNPTKKSEPVGREGFIPSDVFGRYIQIGGSWCLQYMENTIYSNRLDRMLFIYSPKRDGTKQYVARPKSSPEAQSDFAQYF